MKRFFSLILLIGSCRTAALWASCGASVCPLDTMTPEKIEKGWMRLDYSYEYSDQDQPRVGRHRASVGEIPGHHDELFTVSEVQRLGLEAGLTSRWSVQFILPFVQREHQHIHHHMGSDLLESWDVKGMGDLTFLNRVAVVQPENPAHPALFLSAGVKLPTGKDNAKGISQDTTNAIESEEAEVGIQPGSGSTDLILGASGLQSYSVPTLTQAYARLPIFWSTTYRFNGKGKEDYRLGNTLIANAGFVYPLFPKVGWTTQVNLRISRPDDAGKTNEEIEKTGGTYVYASPGFRFELGENFWSYITLQLPIYQRVNEIQLTSDQNLLTGISYRFSAI